MPDEYEDLDELETAFAPFTLKVDDDENGLLNIQEFDPVNLIFPDLRVDEVKDAFERAGWGLATSGAIHSLKLDDHSFIEQVVQLAFYDEDDRRYHVRLWELPDPAVLAAAHHEREFLEDGRIRHRVDAGFEVAEAFVVGDLIGSGEFTRARRASLDEQARRQQRKGDGTEWRGWENHPRASILYPARRGTKTRSAP